MPVHRASERNIIVALAHITAQCVERGDSGKENRKWWAARINEICDSAGDFFGTEGQNDPRGDQRD